MRYEIQAVQPKRGKMDTDVISTNKRRIYDRVKQLTDRGQQCRVRDATGHILGPEEVEDLR